MQKISRSRCSTKSQDGTAKRGSALFVVVNAQADAQGQESFAGFGVATQPAVGSRSKPEFSTGHHNPITP
ncbi:hypothetical protein [Escherichia marmotae]|uniref:hypothetical protein n=1 Tax=Escherichia marmotae TaxID=1499973 RepID=UPI002FE1CB23